MRNLNLGLMLPLLLLAPTAPAQTVIRHVSSPPGIILESVTVKPRATTLYISGQLASPLPSATAPAGSQPATAAFGDTKTQTISALHKIEVILAERGYRVGDVVKLTFFVVGDPALNGKLTLPA